MTSDDESTTRHRGHHRSGDEGPALASASRELSATPSPSAAPVPDVSSPGSGEPGSALRVPHLEIRQGAVRRAETDRLDVVQGAVGGVRAGSVEVRQGAVGGALAGRLAVHQSISRAILAREAQVEQSFVRTLVAAEVRIERATFVGVLLARRVAGDVRVLVDWRGALAFGAAFGILAGLVGRRRRPGEKESEE